MDAILAANAANHAGDPDFNTEAIALQAQSDEQHLQRRQEDISQAELEALLAANAANHVGDDAEDIDEDF